MAEEKKTTRRKPAQKKDAEQKPAAKKSASAEKPAQKKSTARKPAAKKASEKKEPARRSTAKKEGAAKPESKAPAKEEAKPKAQPQRRRKPEPEPVPVLVRASARYVRVAPRKARLVADQVRGLHIEKARALLQFSSRGAARDIGKLLDSAASNAENNHELIADEMKVAEITVDEGPTLRRYRPRALGRATRINKRTSHISVALTPEEDG
jgi:ribosomal protein L22